MCKIGGCVKTKRMISTRCDVIFWLWDMDSINDERRVLRELNKRGMIYLMKDEYNIAHYLRTKPETGHKPYGYRTINFLRHLARKIDGALFEVRVRSKWKSSCGSYSFIESSVYIRQNGEIEIGMGEAVGAVRSIAYGYNKDAYEFCCTNNNSITKVKQRISVVDGKDDIIGWHSKTSYNDVYPY